MARRLSFGLLMALTLVLADYFQRPPAPGQALATWPSSAAAAGTGPLQRVGQGLIPMPTSTPAAHASTLLALPGDPKSTLVAFWFAGQGESQPDVQIAASAFDRQSGQWSAASFVVNREALGRQLGHGVRRIGNPVAWLDAERRIHLFVVATGPGGWAASRIVQLRQASPTHDLADLRLEVVRTLPLSWLWNLSHLVRTLPLPLADGGMLLPVHFELGYKYPMALRFDGAGRFLGMARLSERHHLLQPALLAVTPTKWLALMRDQRPQGHIGVASTSDAGRSWVDEPDLSLTNPDASIAGLALQPSRMLLVHNPSPQSRTELALSQSVDGRNWSPVQLLARGPVPEEYSYPAVAWADGSLWVSYTHLRQAIGWQRFAPAPLAP